MRIGILTLQYGANYGGTLQSYALYNFLKEQGFDVEIINFIPRDVAPLHKRFIYNITMARSFNDICKIFRRFIKTTSSQLISKDLIHLFDQFRSNSMHLTDEVDELTISTLNNRYDTIIVGSDQVWSSMVRSHLTYFGDWVPRYKGKLISYAACAYTDNYPYIRKKQLGEFINKFFAISVRDSLTKSLVKKLSNKDSIIVADPTLLFNFRSFTSPVIIDEPYIIVYILGEEVIGGNNKAIELLKQRLNVNKVVAITPYGKDIPYADITFKMSSPKEWVNLIANAQCVYTDSYHGVIFAIKFRKKFIAYYKEVLRSSRLTDLQERYNIARNFISECDQLCNLQENEIEVSDSVVSSFEELVNKSKEFLISNI